MLFLNLTSVIEAILTDNEKLEYAIESLGGGNHAALGEIYDMTSASVFGYALSLLRNRHDAEDVMHECYLSIANGAQGYRPEGKPLAWILTVTKNLCYMHKRREKNASFVPVEDALNVLDASDEATLEDKMILRECLESLSDTEREIVVLHAVSGFRHREIAEMLDMPLPTVLSKYSRAIVKLKKLLKGDR